MPFIVLLVSGSLFFPYVTGKNFAFRIITEVMVVAWALLALIQTQYRPRWTPILWSVVAFVTVAGVANIFGENLYNSFWSGFERMDGYITLLHLLAYLFVAGAVMTQEKLWTWFWRVSLTVSAFVALHTIALSFGTDVVRLFSTLGNPIYLAMYTLVHVFIALILAARNDISRLERYAYLATLPFLLWSVYLTSARGATLGIIGGLLLTALGIAFSKRDNKVLFRSAIAGVAAIVIFVGGFWLARDSSFVQENPLLQRFASISLTDQSIFSRTAIWGIAWEGIKERPLLGWGQENFNLVFAKYYDPRLYAQEQWFDRTHNVALDWFVSAGIFGVLAYISIYFALLWLIYRAPNIYIVEKWILVGLIAAYGFSNLTVFDNIVSYILFFSLLAWIHTRAVNEKEGGVKHRIRELPLNVATTAGVPIAVVAALLVVWTVNVPAFQVARGMISALSNTATAEQLGAQGAVAEARAIATAARIEFEDLERRGTYGQPLVRESFASAAGNVAQGGWLSDEGRDQWYAKARLGLEAQEALAPNDPRPSFLLGRLHSKFGNEEAAWEAFSRASALSPDKQSILIRLAMRAVNAGNLELGVSISKKAFELEVSNVEARLLYAFALLRSDKEELAYGLLLEDPRAASDERMLAIFIQRGEYDRARELWELGLSEDERDTDRLFSLASIYARKGDAARAQAEIFYVFEKFPFLRDEGLKPEILLQQ
tara:strand:+ start:9301 stop:11445 length:2145 start_codon:yes stop_codon:yes gene_type:complete